MRIFLQRFVVTMLFVVLCTDCNLRSEELDIGRFKQEATMGWQSIMDSYPGFEYSRHEQVVDQNIAPVKALMGSTRRTVTFRFLDRDFFRLDGTMEISKPDLDGITIPKMSSMSDFASLPLKVSKTTFSRIHNDRYDAAIDTTNGANNFGTAICRNPQHA